MGNADTARSVLTSARRLGIFPPRARVADIEDVPERFRGQIVRVLDLILREGKVVAHVELKGEPACTTMNVLPEHLRFLKIESLPSPPPSPLWERGLYRSAMLIADGLWKVADLIDLIDKTGRGIGRGGEIVNNAGHFVLEGAIKITNKYRGWDDD